MKKLACGLALGATLALGGSMLHPAEANPSVDGTGHASTVTPQRDDRPGPRTAEERAKKRKARALIDAGSAKAVQRADGGATVKLGAGDYVEFPVEKSEKILTMLAGFGTQGTPELGTDPGPQPNQIPQPDPAKDNSTYWVPDFDVAHYDQMFNGDGESFRNYYKKLSSGRYDVSITTEDWVTVPGNASTYGDNTVENKGGAWKFIADTGNAWYDAQVKAGKTPAQIDAYLAQFDVWDRYDFDSDGDFNEPDGYLDHFQAVHAGGGEDGGFGADAIWSHRWYVNGDLDGKVGPAVGSTRNLSGGARIGQSKYFIGDYTVEPENGGLGVFTHEFGHDLGLPDFYDTTNTGENSTGFWTLMSAGSWLSHGHENGTTPSLMGPEEKLFLGWLDYSEVKAGQQGSYQLNPSQNTVSGQDQAVKVDLPDKTTVTTFTKPRTGRYAWYSGSSNNRRATLTRAVPKSPSVRIDADLWYDTEVDYDHVYAEYSLDGTEWIELASFDGKSDWAHHTWTYKPGGKASQFRIRYRSDGGTNGAGAFVDNVVVKGKGKPFKDGAERARTGWKAYGFTRSTGTETKVTPRYYLLENRQYVGYDTTLQQGPYQYSESVTRPKWAERFPYQNGMLVWLVDLAYADNNTTTHPGVGYALPVDVRPDSLTYPDGTSPSNRREPFDATFGLAATDPVCLHKQVATANGYDTLAACAPSAPGIATFDDTDPEAYWTATNPTNSVKVAGAGVKATVTAENADGSITVDVRNP